MARLYYKREYDLYRIRSYKELGAWREFFDLLSPALVLFGLVFGGLLFVGMQGGLSVTPILIGKFASLAISGAVGMTVIMIGSKHPNTLISNLFLFSPILVLGLVFLFG